MEEENFSGILPEPTDSLRQCRKWFQAAVDSGKKWRTEAKEDFEFTAGKQWTDEEIKQFQEDGRPAITINRILPLINILSGYQRLNRYDIDFLARTNDDVELCQVRRGITKYIMDRSDYDAVESQVFLDCAIGGLGWFGIRYKFDNEIQDGEAVIERIDPFGIYVDPEAHELDYSDAKFLIRAKWVAKDELKQVYPEQADAIENNFAVYDSVEEDGETRPDIDPLYYSSELQKVCVVECWYREHGMKTIFFTVDGQQFIPVNQQIITQDPIAGTIVQTLNDLSQGEFDIVVSDVESSTTQRQAQMWSLVDAASKLSIPHEAIFETLIDLSDLPKKNDIKIRWQQQQEQQRQQAQQAQQFQLELERMKNADFRMQIAFKDAPLPIQMAMAAQAGIIPQEIADHFLQVMVQQMPPQLAMQMQQQQAPPQMPPPEQMQMPIQQQQMPQPMPQPMPQGVVQ